MHRLAHGHDQTTEEAYHAAALYLQGCLDAETAGSYTTEIFPEVCLANSYYVYKSPLCHRLVNPGGNGTIWVHA